MTLNRLIYISLFASIHLFLIQIQISALTNGYFEWNVTGVQPDSGSSFTDGEPKWVSNAIIYVKQELENDLAKFTGEMRLVQGLQNSPDIKVIFDEFFSTLYLPKDLYICGGQKRYSYSYSYFWSPTFLSNPQRDIYEPERNSEGIPMLVAGYSSSVFSPKLILTTGEVKSVPSIKSKDFRIILNSDFYAFSTEAYLCGTYSPDHEQLVGGGIRRQILENTIHVEGCVYQNRDVKRVSNTGLPAFIQKKHDGYTISVGLNRTFFSGDLFTIEYFRDEGGMTPDEFNTFSGALRPGILRDSSLSSYYRQLKPLLLKNLKPGYMQQDNMYISYNYRIRATWLFGARALISMKDRSGYVYPIITYSPTTSLQFVTEGLFPLYKEKDSEFGLLGTRLIGQFRVRYYF